MYSFCNVPAKNNIGIFAGKPRLPGNFGEPKERVPGEEGGSCRAAPLQPAGCQDAAEGPAGGKGPADRPVQVRGHQAALAPAPGAAAGRLTRGKVPAVRRNGFAVRGLVQAGRAGKFVNWWLTVLFIFFACSLPFIYFY